MVVLKTVLIPHPEGKQMRRKTDAPEEKLWWRQRRGVMLCPDRRTEPEHRGSHSKLCSTQSVYHSPHHTQPSTIIESDHKYTVEARSTHTPVRSQLFTVRRQPSNSNDATTAW